MLCGMELIIPQDGRAVKLGCIVSDDTPCGPSRTFRNQTVSSLEVEAMSMPLGEMVT